MDINERIERCKITNVRERTGWNCCHGLVQLEFIEDGWQWRGVSYERSQVAQG